MLFRSQSTLHNSTRSLVALQQLALRGKGGELATLQKLKGSDGDNGGTGEDSKETGLYCGQKCVCVCVCVLVCQSVCSYPSTVSLFRLIHTMLRDSPLAGHARWIQLQSGGRLSFNHMICFCFLSKDRHGNLVYRCPR